MDLVSESRKPCETPFHRWGGDRRISGTLRPPADVDRLIEGYKLAFHRSRIDRKRTPWQKANEEQRRDMRYKRLKKRLAARKYKPKLSVIWSGDEEEGDEEDGESLVSSSISLSSSPSSSFSTSGSPTTCLSTNPSPSSEASFSGYDDDETFNSFDDDGSSQRSSHAGAYIEGRPLRGEGCEYDRRDNEGYHNCKVQRELMRGRRGSNEEMKNKRGYIENRSNNRNNKENRNNNKSNNKSNKERLRRELLQLSEKSLKRIYKALKKNQKLHSSGESDESLEEEWRRDDGWIEKRRMEKRMSEINII